MPVPRGRLQRSGARSSDTNMTPLCALIIASLHVYLSHQINMCIFCHLNVCSTRSNNSASTSAAKLAHRRLRPVGSTRSVCYTAIHYAVCCRETTCATIPMCHLRLLSVR